ncbi:MAG: hypothetical protein LBH85_06555 [Treponema sp.]|nr:hypothetical protein [Treponema sp.]
MTDWQVSDGNGGAKTNGTTPLRWRHFYLRLSARRRSWALRGAPDSEQAPVVQNLSEDGGMRYAQGIARHRAGETPFPCILFFFFIVLI